MEGLRGFRNSLIGAAWGVDDLSLSEAAVTVAEGGQAGMDQGPGGHIWLLPQWTPWLDSVDRPALVAKDGLVWPCCWLCGPHGAGSLPLGCQVMLSSALRVNEALCLGESRYYFVPWGQHGAGALPWCASALTFCFGSANVPGSLLSL